MVALGRENFHANVTGNVLPVDFHRLARDRQAFDLYAISRASENGGTLDKLPGRDDLARSALADVTRG